MAEARVKSFVISSRRRQTPRGPMGRVGTESVPGARGVLRAHSAGRPWPAGDHVSQTPSSPSKPRARFVGGLLNGDAAPEREGGALSPSQPCRVASAPLGSSPGDSARNDPSRGGGGVRRRRSARSNRRQSNRASLVARRGKAIVCRARFRANLSRVAIAISAAGVSAAKCASREVLLAELVESPRSGGSGAYRTGGGSVGQC